MFYATFLFLDCQRASTARALYQRVLKRWNSLLYLWEAALHFEEHCFEDGREGMTSAVLRWLKIPSALP